jgi:hypothetical protein
MDSCTRGRPPGYLGQTKKGGELCWSGCDDKWIEATLQRKDGNGSWTVPRIIIVPGLDLWRHNWWIFPIIDVVRWSKTAKDKTGLSNGLNVDITRHVHQSHHENRVADHAWRCDNIYIYICLGLGRFKRVLWEDTTTVTSTTRLAGVRQLWLSGTIVAHALIFLAHLEI